MTRLAALASAAAVVAGAGLVLSVLVHLSAVAGGPNPLGRAAWLLHGGIFVVWLPAVLCAQRLTRDARRSDFWRVALRGCPPWMRYMAYAFFAYAMLNFVLFITGAFGDRDDEIVSVRGFSGHWMVFYSVALVLLYSYAHTDTRTRRCAAGHAVSPTASYCETCGRLVTPP
ncbi:MAG TPA: hypothetical protein VGT02_02035 [Methylomirabilota bacterium]|nr:hypothetical protein [Methylomirabilota bacterium]